MAKLIYEITEDYLNLYIENTNGKREVLAEIPIVDIEFSEFVSNFYNLISARIDVSLELKKSDECDWLSDLVSLVHSLDWNKMYEKIMLELSETKKERKYGKSNL